MSRPWRAHLRAATLGAVAGAALTLGAQALTGERAGTDDLARETSERQAPHFVPWASPLLTIGDAAEMWLFALQGMLGGAAFGVSFAALRRERDRAS
jgi:ABC-type cobalt transport system substrate-binding protein